MNPSVTIFSIIRLPFLINLGRTSNPTCKLACTVRLIDPVLTSPKGEYPEVTIWSIWETELGKVCASLPAIRHLFKHVWPNAMGTIAAKMSSFGSSKGTEYEKGGSWNSSRRDRTNNDTKDYYELDERSLIGKEQGAAAKSNVATIQG